MGTARDDAIASGDIFTAVLQEGAESPVWIIPVRLRTARQRTAPEKTINETHKMVRIAHLHDIRPPHRASTLLRFLYLLGEAPRAPHRRPDRPLAPYDPRLDARPAYVSRFSRSTRPFAFLATRRASRLPLLAKHHRLPHLRIHLAALARARHERIAPIRLEPRRVIHILRALRRAQARVCVRTCKAEPRGTRRVRVVASDPRVEVRDARSWSGGGRGAGDVVQGVRGVWRRGVAERAEGAVYGRGVRR